MAHVGLFFLFADFFFFFVQIPYINALYSL